MRRAASTWAGGWIVAAALGVAAALAIGVARAAEAPAAAAALRAPAVPLVTHDPYFSVWSRTDKLTEDWPRHWTGAVNALAGMARIDGKPYRWAGIHSREVPAMEQRGVEITNTRTTYTFAAGGVELKVTFLSPLLPHDLDLLSRPVTYVTMATRSEDGAAHAVSLYLDITGEWAVNNPDQRVTWERGSAGELGWLRIGTVEQPVLAKKGDNLRVDWGHAYLAAPAAQAKQAVASDKAARDGFAGNGAIAAKDDERKGRQARDEWPVLATVFQLGQVAAEPVERTALLAYDDEYSIELMGTKLRPWWRRNGMDANGLLAAAWKERAEVAERCRAYDQELAAALRKAGGDKYERVCALAFRQAIAAHKLAADGKGRPLFFSKENFSNGCIATVDVTYPSAPMFLLLNPELLRGMLTPVLEYAATPRWKFPFAPHDLGTYPKANGQVYGGGEKTEENQMPVEECGNLLILVTALAHVDGNADYAKEHWGVLTKWAEYLKAKGLDPENQLCTDDFAGHLAHNTNLSLKAIVALGGYARLCEQLGKKEEAEAYGKLAREMAAEWQKMAADGEVYKLTFDKPGTWSQKYNLVWDKLLGLKLFPAEVAAKEVKGYLARQNAYGLPLDSRKTYTKLDWIVWSATLAEKPEDFEALVAPIHRFLHESPSRVPMTDWYDTVSGKQVGFQARSVVGGVFIKVLEDPAAWKAWAGKAKQPQ